MDDVVWLAGVLPIYKNDAAKALDVEERADRFIYSAAYCREGERRLK